MVDALYQMILDYEESILPTKETIELFQFLVLSGKIWNMPTRYLDVVGRMVHNGHLTFPRREVP